MCVLGNFIKRDGVVVTASASQSAGMGFISKVESFQGTLKNGIHSFSAWRLAQTNGVENKPASFLGQDVLRDAYIFMWQTGGRSSSPPSHWPRLSED